MGSPDYAPEHVVESIEFVQAKRFRILDLGLNNAVSAHIMSMFCTLLFWRYGGARVRAAVLRDIEARLFGFLNSEKTIRRSLDYLTARGFISRDVKLARAGLEIGFLPPLTRLQHSWTDCPGENATPATQLVKLSNLPGQRDQVTWTNCPGSCLLKKREKGDRGCAQAREEDDFKNRSRRKEETKSRTKTVLLSTDQPERVSDVLRGDDLTALLNASGLTGTMRKV
jgi:hypothetical protein